MPSLLSLATSSLLPHPGVQIRQQHRGNSSFLLLILLLSSDLPLCKFRQWLRRPRWSTLPRGWWPPYVPSSSPFPLLSSASSIILARSLFFLSLSIMITGFSEFDQVLVQNMSGKEQIGAVRSKTCPGSQIWSMLPS